MKTILIIVTLFFSLNIYSQGAGYALNFDGINDNVQGHAADLTAITNNFTIEFWFNASATIALRAEQNGVNHISGTTGNGQRYAVYPQHGGGGNGSWGNAGAGVSIGSNAIQVYEHKASYMPCLLSYSGSLIQAGWNHVAIVYINKRPRLYLNGINVKDGLTSNQNNVFPSGLLGGSPYGWYSGDLDEFRVWSTSRTQGEIRTNMCRKLIGNETGLVRYYRLDDGTGGTTIDATGNVNGSLISMTPATDWIASGAALGNTSSNSYNTTTGLPFATSINLINPGGQDELTISNITGTPSGIHVYGENNTPNVTCGALGVGANDRYFGVFIIDGSTTAGIPTYNITYNYANNPYVHAINEPNLDFANRATNAVITCNAWNNLSATLNMVTDVLVKNNLSGRNEFILTSETTPLPIDLVYFNALTTENTVQLVWVTASEINNDYFTIERSVDTQHWEDIITINGAGNSNQIIEYTEIDLNPLNGISYYRLKQTDFDGKYKYFNTVPINFEKNNLTGFNIYPNPISYGEILNIVVYDFKPSSEIIVIITDLLGKEFYSKSNIQIKNHKLITIPINLSIPKGIYFIVATSENKIHSKKLIIK